MKLILFSLSFILCNVGNSLRLPSTEKMLQNLEQRLNAKISNLEEEMKIETKQLRTDISLIFDNLVVFENSIKLLLTEQNPKDGQDIDIIKDKSQDESGKNADRLREIDTRIDGLETVINRAKELREDVLDTVRSVSTAVSLLSDDIGEIRDGLNVVQETVSVNRGNAVMIEKTLKSVANDIKQEQNRCKISEDLIKSGNLKLDSDLEDIRSLLNDTINHGFSMKKSEPTPTVYRSCRDGVTRSGVYKLHFPGLPVFDAYCDMDTDGGGWLVFQRRINGGVDFFRDWIDYKRGFGDVSGEFWLGNNIINKLTTSPQVLRVDLWDWDGTKAYAQYEKFSIGSEWDKYKLHVSGYSGTAGDSMRSNNNKAFATKDHDSTGCANNARGAWWYWSCTYSNLNGFYYPYAKHNDWGCSGLCWHGWKRYHYSLKGSEMKIRPK